MKVVRRATAATRSSGTANTPRGGNTLGIPSQTSPRFLYYGHRCRAPGPGGEAKSPPLCCLGEFAAAAEQWAAQLAMAEIYVSFGVNQTEPAPDAATDELVRLYVRPEDESAARKILDAQGNG